MNLKLEHEKMNVEKKQNSNEQKLRFCKIDDFNCYVFDFIENYLIKNDEYVKLFDKFLLTHLEKMTYEDRIKKFEFRIQSEGNANLALFLTYSYLANKFKHSGKMDLCQESKIPLIESMISFLDNTNCD